MATTKHAPYNKLKATYPIFLEWRTGKVEMCFIKEKNEEGIVIENLNGERLSLPKRTFGFVWRGWFFKPTEEQQKNDSWRHT